jgi:hypothetical protein
MSASPAVPSPQFWFQPGPSFGYTLTRIGEHPWNTLITMKEVLRLDPGSLVFTGPHAEGHARYWRAELPQLFDKGRAPEFELDTSPIHPHVVESTPRKPFEPYKDR